jgi:hypothetical protein
MKLTRHPIAWFLDRAALTHVVMLYLFYPTSVKQAISIFACDKIGREWYLAADFEGRKPCDSPVLGPGAPAPAAPALARSA